MDGFPRRLGTAAVFVAVMLGGVWGGPYSFVLLFGFIAAACLWEYLNLVLARGLKRDLARKVLGMFIGLAPYLFSAIITLNDSLDPSELVITGVLLFFPFLFSIFIYELFTLSIQPFRNVGSIVLGMLYVGIPFAMLQFVAYDGDRFYRQTVLGLLLLTWVNDTGAFLVGSAFGKHPLFPSISPKKTWEGSLGGLVLTLAISVAVYYVVGGLELIPWMVIALIIVLFGSIGDLVESMLKRSINIKDSGTLLPGHGGVLDRFDAFMFMLPYASAYILYIR